MDAGLLVAIAVGAAAVAAGAGSVFAPLAFPDKPQSFHRKAFIGLMTLAVALLVAALAIGFLTRPARESPPPPDAVAVTAAPEAAAAAPAPVPSKLWPPLEPVPAPPPEGVEPSRTEHSAHLAKLQEFYQQGIDIQGKLGNPDITDDGVNQQIIAANRWISEVCQWLKENMREGSCGKFGDASVVSRVGYPLNGEHPAQIIKNRLNGMILLTTYTHNLETMMGTTIWDRD